jgi:hypothetical protein
VSFYALAYEKLHDERGISDRNIYLDVRQCVEDARHWCDIAMRDLEEHLEAHGCAYLPGILEIKKIPVISKRG